MNVQFARIVRSFFGLEIAGFEPLGLGASRRIPSSPPVGKPDSIKSSIVKSNRAFFILVSSLNSHFILAAIRKNCAFFFGLVTRGFEPLGLGASRRIPSSPPVGKPDSIKSSIVKSGFLLFLRLKNLFYSTQADKNPHCSRKWLKAGEISLSFCYFLYIPL